MDRLVKNLCLSSSLLLAQLLLLTVFLGESDAAHWQLKWSPKPDENGLGQGMRAFEGIEDDRNHSDPGVKHIFVDGSHYRFNLPLKLRDTLPNRQRIEVKGMRDTSGNIINIFQGETWQLKHSLYIPSTLKATTKFTHIMQIKEPGNATNPILTISLRIRDGIPTIELQLSTGAILGSTPLAPLQDAWIHSSIIFAADDSASIQWILKDSKNATLVDATGHNQDLWLSYRSRPKWGIYRSTAVTEGLEDCFMFIKDLQALRLA